MTENDHTHHQIDLLASSHGLINDTELTWPDIHIRMTTN